MSPEADRLARLEAENARLKQSEAMLRDIIRLAHDAIVCADAERRIFIFNRSAERMFGYAAAEILGRPLDLLLPERVRPGHARQMEGFGGDGPESAMLAGRPALNARRRDGTEFPAEIAISRLRTTDGTVYTAIVRDLTQQRAAEEALRRLATTDPLTGILNRRAFAAAAVAEFERVARYGTPLAVAMLDIDHFKQVNDRFGHANGDRVLVGLVHTVSSGLRSTDVFCRHGGEEFALLLPHTDLAAALELAERLRQRVALAPVDGDEGPMAFTISIGVAAVTAGLTLDEALARADTALYRAKADGRNRVAAWSP